MLMIIKKVDKVNNWDWNKMKNIKQYKVKEIRGLVIFSKEQNNRMHYLIWEEDVRANKVARNSYYFLTFKLKS